MPPYSAFDVPSYVPAPHGLRNRNSETPRSAIQCAHNCRDLWPTEAPRGFQIMPPSPRQGSSAGQRVPLGPPLAGLSGLLLGAPWAPCWGLHGLVLGSPMEPRRGAIWGPSWGPLEPHLKHPWGPLGPSWRPLGSSLGATWDPQGA